MLSESFCYGGGGGMLFELFLLLILLFLHAKGSKAKQAAQCTLPWLQQ